MKQMDEAKRKYDEILIPDELSDRVRAAVGQADEKRSQAKKILQMRKRKKAVKGGIAAAAAVVLFTAGLNTSTAFAEGVSAIPVIGTVARVLTFRSYETTEDDMYISVDIPSVEMISEDLGGLENQINEEIHGFCEAYADEAKERACEYRKAFLETGGTEEEWKEHNIKIKVWYDVKSQTDQILSLTVTGSENWSTAYSETKYYSIDLENGKLLTLEDVLGEEYAQIADESIREQMKEREENEGIVYWTEEEAGFSGVSENTNFYINQDGNPVIVFEAYEVAPGAYGTQEFVIEK